MVTEIKDISVGLSSRLHGQENISEAELMSIKTS